MMKKFSLFMAVVLTLFMISSGNVFAKEFINGIDANFPPFAYVDKSGKPGGFDIDPAGLAGFGSQTVPVCNRSFQRRLCLV